MGVEHRLCRDVSSLCVGERRTVELEVLVEHAVDRKLDREDLLGERVWIEEGEMIPRTRIATGPRVGIAYAEEWIEKPWRFWLKDNPFVSKR